MDILSYSGVIIAFIASVALHGCAHVSVFSTNGNFMYTAQVDISYFLMCLRAKGVLGILMSLMH